jgi:hypothetical protein
MPDIHIGLVELTVLVGGGVLSFGALQWQTNQNKKDIEKLTNKHETLEKDIVEKLSALLVSVAEMKGQLNSLDREKR